MPELDADSTAEGYVKQLVTWASVAYAGGFVTVTLHTWRLGLPVIELVQPIYVWVGLPLAVVAFFFEGIARAFRGRSAALAGEIRQGWAQVASPDIGGGLEVAADVVGLVRALPLGWLVSVPVTRMAESLLRKLQQLQEQRQPADRRQHERTAREVQRVLGAFRVISAMSGALTLVNYAVIICLGVGLYVWEVYPRVPQSLGGGRPSMVKLVAETSALPGELAPEPQPPSSTAAPEDRGTVSLPVRLLYLTKDAYFVETKSGARLSIKADAVKSVMWIQPTDPHPLSAGAK